MTKTKAEIIDERKAALPLPEQPPVASDWNSYDQRVTSVGSGAVEGGIAHGAASESGLREPATKESGVRVENGAIAGKKLDE